MRAARPTFLVCVFLLAAALGCTDGRQPSQPASASTTIKPADGGALKLSDGTSLTIPADALASEIQVSLTRGEGAPPVPDWAAMLGGAVNVDLRGQTLAEPATLEIPYDPSKIPEGLDADHVFVAYFDDASGQWVPVGGIADPDRRVVIVETTHASWWQPWTWILDAIAQGIVTAFKLDFGSLVDAFAAFDGCSETESGVIIDESANKDYLGSCLDVDDPLKPQIRLINRRTFHVKITPLDGPVTHDLAGVSLPLARLERRSFRADFSAARPDQPLVVRAEVDWFYTLSSAVLELVELVPGVKSALDADGRARILRAIHRNTNVVTAAELLARGDIDGFARELDKALLNSGMISEIAKAIAEGAPRGSILSKINVQGWSIIFGALKALGIGVQFQDAVRSISGGPGELKFYSNRPLNVPTSQAVIDQYLSDRGLTGRIVGRADVTGDGIQEAFVHASGPSLGMRGGVWFVFQGGKVIFERNSGATGPLMEIPGTCEANAACIVAPPSARPAGFRAISAFRPEWYGGNCCPALYQALFLAWDGTKFFTAAEQKCPAREVRGEGLNQTGSGGPNCAPAMFYATPEEAVRALFTDASLVVYNQERAGTVVYTVAGPGGEPGDVFLRRSSAGWAVVSSGCSFGFQDCWEFVPD